MNKLKPCPFCGCAAHVYEDGTVVKMIKVENLAWTGRHFDEIADLLKKMRKEDED